MKATYETNGGDVIDLTELTIALIKVAGLVGLGLGILIGVTVGAFLL